ncbi:MAG: hypothetical protein Q9165_006847 [Trypethelium subeluteriae]
MLRRISFGGDDLAIVLALPVAWGISISTFLMVRYGYGKHGDVLPKSDMKHFTQSLLSGEILWTIAIPLIKISICLFYRRIFGEIKYMRYATSIIAVFSVCWGIIASTVSLARFAILLHWQKVVDPTWNYYYPYLFCTIEAHIGIVSVCLPTLRPLVQSALAQAKDSFGRSSSKADTPSPEQAWTRVPSKSDGIKSTSQTYSYEIVVRPASNTSEQSGNERFMNPNDLSFWRSIGSHA